jgi:dipeptidyl aminopeptidase/acylaminoacyl peptidase
LFVILATGPRVPGTYYLLSRENLELSRIGDRYASHLKPEQLHDVERVSYVARDGLTIPAYLTRPVASGPLPMVVLPHGGPTTRDYLGFDPVAQFLASRGLAVLQPNFRGSSGYGAAFEAAGYGEWGLAMQDDVTDGVRAMIERGIADAERICIVGWSYGGYVALMGAVKTPDLYRCAVSGAGITDIRRMLSEGARYKFGLKDRPAVGDYQKDRGKLKDTSPINNVEAIKIPILLVHGDKDRSVPIGHSKKMAAKLKKLGKPHRMVVLKDGNHRLSLERNRVQFLRELESFLTENLDGKKE